MAMSKTEACAKCGHPLANTGTCDACGSPVSKGFQAVVSQVRMASAPAAATPGGRESASRPVRPAFLLNVASNEKHALNQSVSKIGRDQTNNISIRSDHYISRHHAWVLQMNGGYWVEDLGSTNGTLLNGEALNDRRQVSTGDRLTFGKTEFVFSLE